MVRSCPIPPFFLQRLGFVHIVKFLGDIWVRGSGYSLIGYFVWKLVLKVLSCCWKHVLLLFFIDFNLKFLSNSLQSPLLHEATLFLLSIDHVCSYILSNVPGIEFLFPFSSVFWFLLLYILLLYWWCLVIVLDPHIDLDIVVLYIMLTGLHWTHYGSSILLEV